MVMSCDVVVTESETGTADEDFVSEELHTVKDNLDLFVSLQRLSDFNAGASETFYRIGFYRTHLYGYTQTYRSHMY